MGWFTRTLVLLVAGAFFAMALLALARGEYRVALGAFVFGLFVAFIGAIGWFERRFPLPPLPPGERPTLFGEARRYLRHHPGWPARIAVAAAVLTACIGLVRAAGRMMGW